MPASLRHDRAFAPVCLQAVQTFQAGLGGVQSVLLPQCNLRSHPTLLWRHTPESHWLSMDCHGYYNTSGYLPRIKVSPDSDVWVKTRREWVSLGLDPRRWVPRSRLNGFRDYAPNPLGGESRHSPLVELTVARDEVEDAASWLARSFLAVWQGLASEGPPPPFVLRVGENYAWHRNWWAYAWSQKAFDLYGLRKQEERGKLWYNGDALCRTELNCLSFCRQSPVGKFHDTEV